MNPLLIGPLFELVKQALGGLGLDPAAKERAQAQALQVITSGTFEQNADLQIALAQIGTNNREAEAPGLFKGGWRPAAGWMCVVGLAAQLTVAPLLAWGIESATGHKLPALPVMDTATLMGLLVPLLGLGGYRSAEKIKGAA